MTNFSQYNNMFNDMSLLREYIVTTPIKIDFNRSNGVLPNNITPFDLSANLFPNIEFPKINLPKSLDTNNIFSQASAAAPPCNVPPQPMLFTAETSYGTIIEPEETDGDIIIETSAPTEYSKTKKTKVRKADSQFRSSAFVAEEVLDGQYVHKVNGKNIKDLKPYMKEALVKLSKKAEELGYTLVVNSGYRSHEKQKELKKQTPRKAASPYRSAHEYGAAFDIALYKNGRKVNDIKIEVPELGRYAQSIGLEWGATWGSRLYEPWHFNIKGWRELADIKPEYDRLNSRG